MVYPKRLTPFNNNNNNTNNNNNNNNNNNSSTDKIPIESYRSLKK